VEMAAVDALQRGVGQDAQREIIHRA
jgi:hypothetical protein